MKANLFAYSRHGSDDAGRSPQTKRFLSYYSLSYSSFASCCL